MRLINTETLEFEEFYDAQIPPYAILSHTWGSNEVTFKDYHKRVIWDPEDGDPATEKVLKTCELARSDGLRYVWVDSCCIDKSSSAELSEAINSMYKWYQGSEICYTYLDDFDCDEDHSSGNSSKNWAGIDRCRWFTRGWTLQELIAPQSLHFYDRNWKFVGQKKYMRDEISLITGIPCRLLAQSIYPSGYPVARRMSWVAHRQTSREEDLAYCLLGLFDVNMPLLYGEGGQKAFIRLQEHIMKDTNDTSIFAWQPDPLAPTGSLLPLELGMLVSRPEYFSSAHNIAYVQDDGGRQVSANDGQTSGTIFFFSSAHQNPEFSVTNKGIKIISPLKMAREQDGRCFLPLGCYTRQGGNAVRLGIWLHNIEGILWRDLQRGIVAEPMYPGLEWVPAQTLYMQKEDRWF